MPGRSSPPMPAQVVAVVQQRVDQRAAGVAGRRVHDHARRLVDHDQVGVLVEDVERDVLGLRRRRGAGSGTSTATTSPVRFTSSPWLARPPPATCPSLISRCSWNATARRRWRPEAVEPLAGLLASDRPSSSNRRTPAYAAVLVLRFGAPRACGAPGAVRRPRQSTTSMRGPAARARRDELRRREPEDHAARVAAEELDDEPRDRIEQHVEPERAAGEPRPPLLGRAAAAARISSSAPPRRAASDAAATPSGVPTLAARTGRVKVTAHGTSVGAVAAAGDKQPRRPTTWPRAMPGAKTSPVGHRGSRCGGCTRADRRTARISPP